MPPESPDARLVPSGHPSDLHGDNQVWDRDELRLVLDFENIGAAATRS